MIAQNKRKIEDTLSVIPDEFVEDILNYLYSLQLKKTTGHDTSSMLLSEDVLAKEWLSKEEEEAWANL